jgi:hypothetical protein
MVAAGAAGCLLGTLLLNWASLNLLFTRIGAKAWDVGGAGALAVVLALAVAAGAGLLLGGESAPVRVPPLAVAGACGLLAVLAVLPIVQGQAGAGAFVTLASAGLAAYAAYGLSGTSAPGHRQPVARRAPAQAAATFCPSCGNRHEGGSSFCASCGARLR